MSCQNGLDFQGVSFSGNKAIDQGGAIKWDLIEPAVDGASFMNNSAVVYGDDIASVAKYVMSIPGSDIYKKTVEPLRRLNTNNETS